MENNSDENRDRLIRYLGDLRDYQEAYRRSKERTAWLATVLYLSALLVAGGHFPPHPPYWKWLLGFLAATAFIVGFFIRREFKERRKASTRVSAASSLLAKLVDPGFEFVDGDLEPVGSDTPEGGMWPEILWKEYSELGGSRDTVCAISQGTWTVAVIVLWTMVAVLYWLPLSL